MTGFEPVTFCTQNKRATKLRYIPFNSIGYNSLIVKNPCLVFHILKSLIYLPYNYIIYLTLSFSRYRQYYVYETVS